MTASTTRVPDHAVPLNPSGQQTVASKSSYDGVLAPVHTALCTDDVTTDRSSTTLCTIASNGELVVLMNFDEPVNFALPALQGMASGTWLANAQLTQLYDGEEMDAEVARQAAVYVPPGPS